MNSLIIMLGLFLSKISNLELRFIESPLNDKLNDNDILKRVVNNHKRNDILKKLESKKISTFSKLELINSMTDSIKVSDISSGGLMDDWNFNETLLM